MKDWAAAWVAGFIDGEGCFTVRDYNPGYPPRIAFVITQVDRRPLDRFVALTGLGRVKGPKKHSGQPNSQGYHWVNFQGKKVDQLFEMVSQFLSEPKTEQYYRCKKRVVER